jgi:hypothetical protein
MTEKKLIPFLFLVFSLFFVSYSFAAEVHFQWGTSSGVVDGYRIYYGSSNEGPYPNLLDQVGGTTTECFASLNEGQEYYLVVRAFNDYGESGNSNEIKWPSDEGDSNTIVFGDASGADYSGTIQDTFINLNDGNSVSSESLNTYTWPTDQVANAIILKADLAAIPDGAYVQSATLHLYMNSIEGGGGDDLYDISVHEIINYNPDLSQCSGYTYDGTNSWTPNGSRYDNIPLAQSDIAAAEDVKSIDKTYGYKTWDVTNMVHDWIANPNMNFGLLVNSDSSASNDSYRTFASSEASDPNQRPKLVVTYTVGDDTTAPGDVSGFTATPGPDRNQITLAWTNPTDTDFAGVMVRYRTDGTNPQNKDDGSPIPNGNEGKIAGSPGQNMSYVHTNLDPDKHYYYSAFSYDISNNYSQTAYADAQPLSPNNAPVIQSFTSVPSSLNNPGESTTFNVSATDPDGDSFTPSASVTGRPMEAVAKWYILMRRKGPTPLRSQ